MYKKTIKIFLIFIVIFLYYNIFAQISFDSGKAEIKQDSYPYLDKIGEEIKSILKEKPDLKIKISGHTDNIGREASNLKLSLERAKAIVNYLSDKFKIPVKNFETYGYGSKIPIADNSSQKGRAFNRRVEIEFDKKKIVLTAAKEEPLKLSVKKNNENNFILSWDGNYKEYNIIIMEIGKNNQEVQVVNQIVNDNQFSFIGKTGEYKSIVFGVADNKKENPSNEVRFEILLVKEKKEKINYKIGFLLNTGFGFLNSDSGRTFMPARIGFSFIFPSGIGIMLDGEVNRIFTDDNKEENISMYSMGFIYEMAIENIKPFLLLKGIMTEVLIKNSRYRIGYGIETGIKYILFPNFAINFSGEYIKAYNRGFLNLESGLEVFILK